jgi:DNA-binding PadR family transcriptional regulator
MHPMPKTKNTQSKFIKCPCIGATLDKLVQPAMLAILAKGPLHGYELAKKVGDIPHFIDEAPDVSGVYRMLKTLEARGMVTSGWDISKGERPKRLFTITNEGRQCLAHWNDTLRNYHKSIGSLLKTTQKAVSFKCENCERSKKNANKQ